jgi:hypothetical protein
MYALLAMAAPVLVPPSALLRPRFGQFPLILLALCLLWVLLMRVALPGFGRRATLISLLASGLLVLSWLPRIAARTWGRPVLTPAYYHLVILPTTVVQMMVLLSIGTTPIWLPLALLSRRRRRAAQAPASPAPTAAPEVPPPAPPEVLPPSPLSLPRRDMLGVLAWAGPGTALALAGYGVAVGAQQIQVRRLRIRLPGLPPSLRGLRLGQITDVHVSDDLTPLRQLERGCELLAGERLDLMLTTGDLCDHPRLLRDVLRLIGEVPARLGHYACLGNHELYLGLPHVRRTHERSAVRLLEDESVRIGDLTLASVSYPHSGSPRIDHRRVGPMLDQALRDRRRGDATVLLSHHPHVVRHLGGRDVGLMLSGHTHGGQLALGERSLLEPVYGFVRGLFPDAAGTGAQLFVSSGLGHWLPWRVGCPPEVVVIELV